MGLDAATASYAFGVGVASFFSPCSVGLLPAYVGYYLGAENEAQANPWVSARKGMTLGAVASLGFLAIFLVLAFVVRLLPLREIGPRLPFVGIIIGVAIIALGLLLLFGRDLALKLPSLPVNLTQRNLFFFGIAYALASVGCTFPLFLSVVLGAAGSGNAATAALALLIYGAGMALVMIVLTTALAVSRTGATRFVRRATPVFTVLAPLAMIAGGAYLVYYWIDAYQALTGTP